MNLNPGMVDPPKRGTPGFKDFKKWNPVQEMLSEDLVLKVDYKVDGKVKVLKGKSLVCTAGVVWKKFNIETAPDEGKKEEDPPRFAQVVHGQECALDVQQAGL